MSRFADILAGLGEGLRAARYHQSLNRLTDRELANIGLSRENIARRAVELARTLRR